MCGIVGLWYRDDDRPAELETLARMTGKVFHRGPDDEGFWSNGPVGLGHRRLSIIDLSAAGHQPMTSEDETLWLAFNGEIYNFPELRAACEARGHVFRSDTDSEVILHLYEDYGPDVVLHLNGMFAFGLWDERRRRMLLAVDRVGKKPLRYAAGPWGLAFASEMKSLLVLPEVAREIDQEAVWHYLTLGYIPAPMTGFRDVRKLPAAHRMIYEHGRSRIERYWQVDFSRQEQKSEGEWQEEILDLLDDAVKIRMISDVPLGAFLSGGIDSSAIVALMARHSSQPVRTFSIGFTEEKYNELPAARDVARWFSTDHTELVVRPSAMEIFPRLIDAYGEPYADSSALPSYYLAQLTRQYVTVALNGDGGDENFAGYERYSMFERYDRMLSAPRALRLGAGMRALGRAVSTLAPELGWKMATAGDLSHPDLWQRYLKYIASFDARSKRRVVRREFAERFHNLPTADLLAACMREPQSGASSLDKMLYFDINQYLPYDLLVKMDIATMVHSLEGRSPLLDYRMLELSGRIPAEMKLRNGEKKYILKKALGQLLPEEHMQRRKMGFGIPIHEWFRGELRDMAVSVLTASKVAERGILEPAEVRQLLDDHLSGRRREGVRIWTLLFLEMWFRRWVDGEAP